MRALAATIVFALSVALFWVALASAAPAEPVSPLRGMELYGNHCTVCHQSTVHIREKRKARSLAQIEVWVRRWASVLNLDWGEEEIRAVAAHLNAHYYRY